MADQNLKVRISNVALVKMIKHGRNERPYMHRVAGCLFGSPVNGTIQVDDAIAIPSTADVISDSSELVFKLQVLGFLNKTACTKPVVGFYISSPGCGGWLSRTDCEIFQSHEEKNPGCIGMVLDPKVAEDDMLLIDAFRLLQLAAVVPDPASAQMPTKPGKVIIPSLVELCNEFERQYYSIDIKYWENKRVGDGLILEVPQ